MIPVETPALRPLTGFAPLFTWGLKRTLSAKKFWIGGTLAGVIVFVLGQMSRASADRAYELYGMLDNLVLGVAVPLAALGLVGGGFGEEVSEQTLVYHLVRPVRRSTLFFARYAAGLLPAVAVAAALVVAARVGTGAPVPWEAVGSLCGAAAIGVATLGAVYYAIAALFRLGLIAGLLYTFVLEGLFQFLPGSMQKLSLTHHVRSLAHRWTDADFAALSDGVREEVASSQAPAPDAAVGRMFGQAFKEPWTSVESALLISGVVVVVALVVGARKVERRDFPLKD